MDGGDGGDAGDGGEAGGVDGGDGGDGGDGEAGGGLGGGTVYTLFTPTPAYCVLVHEEPEHGVAHTAVQFVSPGSTSCSDLQDCPPVSSKTVKHSTSSLHLCSQQRAGTASSGKA